MARIAFARKDLTRGRGVCLAAGFATGAVLGHRLSRTSSRPMPHLRTFRRALAATRGEVMAAILAARIQACYNALLATRPRFAHPALRVHLRYQLLPGLALYMTLKEDAARRGVAQAAALAETGEILTHMDVLGPVLRFLRRLPLGIAVYRLMFPPMMALFPASGWDIRFEENSRRRIAFKISRCFYLDVLTAYGAPELTAQFCQIDDIAYKEMTPAIRWERATTLGRGGPYCDFCWRVAGAEQPQRADARVPVG